jgi:cytochrome b561
MRLGNSRDAYGVVAVALHWSIAIAILFMIWLGDTMTANEDYDLYQLHKSIGITILVLSLIRLAVRFLDPPPPLPNDMAWWERFGARVSHWGFYGLMIGLPLSGWAYISASPTSDFVTTSIWSLFDLPLLPGLASLQGREAVADQMEDIHGLLSTLTLCLLALHVAAALKHHFWNRDNVLMRMIPFLGRSKL